MVAYSNISANMHLGCDYVPDLVWFGAASRRGLVIAFTGAQLWLKVDRQTDILTVLSDVPGKLRPADQGDQTDLTEWLCSSLMPAQCLCNPVLGSNLQNR